MGRNFEKLSFRLAGFTLIEMLAVITIIGIFSGFLFPYGGKIIRKANLSKDAHNLRQIALSYTTVAQTDDDHEALFENIGTSNNWAICLAAHGGINEKQCYLSTINKKKSSGTDVIVDKFGDKVNNFDEIELSWVCLCPIPNDAPIETTPLLYSAGLDTNKGQWTLESIYGQEGGFIVYLDGHVKFYNHLKDQLINYQTGRPTSYIQEAVPGYTHAYDSHGRLW